MVPQLSHRLGFGLCEEPPPPPVFVSYEISTTVLHSLISELQSCTEVAIPSPPTSVCQTPSTIINVCLHSFCLLAKRYRDNLYMFGRRSHVHSSVDSLIVHLQGFFGIPLQFGQQGPTIQGLECQVSLHSKLNIDIRLHSSVIRVSTLANSHVKRWPDPWSSNCDYALRSMVRWLIHKSDYWASSNMHRAHNSATSPAMDIIVGHGMQVEPTQLPLFHTGSSVVSKTMPYGVPGHPLSSNSQSKVFHRSPPPPLTPPPGGWGTVPWPQKHRKYWVPKAPKLIYTVMLWYSFVVQLPPPPRGGGTVTTLVAYLIISEPTRTNLLLP